MASVADRWHVTNSSTGKKERSARFGKGKRWQVRYRDPAGESRNRSFDKKVDAERCLIEVSDQLLRGRYVDARAGRMPLEDYAASWLERQVLAPMSLEAVELRVRVHLLPAWHGVPLVGIRPAAVQRWIRLMQGQMSPSYLRLIVTTLSTILNSAVEEGLIATNPCRSGLVKVPAVPAKRITPWRVERTLAVIDAIPQRYRAALVVAAGCGLRQGECFGFARTTWTTYAANST